MNKICKKMGSYLILAVASFCFLLPFYPLLCSASGGNTSMSDGLVLPGPDLWKNIYVILTKTEFLSSLWFTLRYTVLQTILTLLICGLAGFAFEIYQDKYKDILFKIVLFAMMISITPLMVPLYQLYMRWGIIDTMWGLMAPFIASPMIIMIFRQNSRGFPYELIEAARLDGMNELGIFFRIYLPCMKGTFSCGTIIAFLNAWNSYQWPHLIMYDEHKIPMTVFLTLGLNGNNMTVVLMSMIPSMIVFFIFQKFFVKGMNGALK